jgi:hypothetical protein
VSVKKAKSKSKAAAKKSAKKKGAAKINKPADMVAVRENINDLVRDSAEFIASKVIEVARTGQLASAKYLFEAVGLYPATEETAPTPIKDTLAHTLLTRMGLPLEPVITDEDMVKPISTGSLRSATVRPIREAEEDSADEEVGEESGDELVAVESDE